MIVEDDAELRGIVTTLLTSEGYQVEQVADGRMAVERVFLLKPGLILVDLNNNECPPNLLPLPINCLCPWSW